MMKLVPYHFVPLGKEKRLSAPVDPFDATLLEGKISCTLTIKTPLFIPNTSGEPKMNKNAQKTRVFYSLTQLGGEISERCGSPTDPVIPGSSIRGMLRNVHEAASNGCMHILSGKYNDLQWARIISIAKKKGNFAPCTGKENNLCPTCSLFGMVGRGHEEETHAGRIRVSDAKAQGSIEFGEFRWLPPQMEPKVSAIEFYTYVPDAKAEKWDYTNENLCLKGRKFYWHHQPVRNLDDEANYQNNRFCNRVQPIETGTFTFDVYFDGITAQELRQLAALINLKGNDGFKRQFKLGNAKAQGYGSVETGIQSIFIRRITWENGNILHQQEDVTADYQDIAMEKAFQSDLTDLLTILDPRTLGSADVCVEYPSQWWYQNQTSDDYSRSDYVFSHKLDTIAGVKKEAAKHPRLLQPSSQPSQNPEPEQYSEEDMKPATEDDWAFYAAKFAKSKKNSSAGTSGKKKKRK